MNHRAQIVGLLTSHPLLSRRQLSAMLNMELATLDWTLHSLVRDGTLERPRRGCYALCGARKGREYAYSYSDSLLRCEALLAKRFADKRCALWESAQFFALAGVPCPRNVVFVEAEKSACEEVFAFLKAETSQAVLYTPTPEDMRHYAEKTTIVVRKMISQAPVVKAKPYARLEKLLVDLVAEKRLASMLELQNIADILKNALEIYRVSPTTLMRYAQRRGVGEAFRELLLKYPQLP